MKKRLLPVILALLLIFTVPAIVCAYDYTAVVASQAAQQTAQQVTVNQTGHVPLKNLCQIIGASLTFDESTGAATVQYQEHTIIFTANSKQVTIDSKPIELNATVFI
ncbi:MAG: stalk domain-containing protein, partial [Syntrophomonas sp.]